MKLSVAVLLVVFGICVANATQPFAICQMKGTKYDPTITGTVQFSMTSGNVIKMDVSVAGITQNLAQQHGIHIHELGDISADDGTSAQSHWNPYGKAHGCPDQGSPNYHNGDTGNWYVNADGTIESSKTLSSILTMNANNSIIGHAVVIHNKTDDCLNTGSSGARLAYCVIGIANPSEMDSDETNTAMNTNTIVTNAVCDLTPVGNSNMYGRVWLVQNSSADNIKIFAKISNATGDVMGFHIHEFGHLSDDGMAAGDHYNPLNTVHGIPPITPRHIGDLGSINTYVGEYAYFQAVIEGYLVNLTGSYNVIGRAIIIHENYDNCQQPAGGAGARLAQCVIGLSDQITGAPPAGEIDTVDNSAQQYCLGSAFMVVPSMFLIVFSMVLMALWMQ